MENSLFALSEEYYNAAQLQSQAIANVRAKYNALPNRFVSREGYRLHRLLQSLYSQRRELLATSAHLRHYYRLSGTSKEVV